MIALLLIVILVAIIAEVKSLRRSVDDVQYRMEPSVKSVEQEEMFLLKTTIENRSRFNIPYLFVEEAIPDEIELLDEKEYAYIMERLRSLDIDTEEDFNYAEFLIEKGIIYL